MRPGSGDEHSSLEEAVGAAEAELRAGRWPQALSRYYEILRARLQSLARTLTGAPTLTAADAIIIERLADISLLVGRVEEAIKLFQALAASFRHAGNSFAADIIAVKLLHIATSAGDRPAIKSALASLATTIGDFDQIGFDEAGLAQFEEACQWNNAQAPARALFFAQFFLEAGRLFAWLGQYGDATAALCRTLSHSGKSESATLISLTAAAHLELAAVALACGDLAEAHRHLAISSADTNQVGHDVRHRELSSQAAVLAGDFGSAERALTAARELCIQHHFTRAAATAAMNLIHVLVLVNRTVDADRLLHEVEAEAESIEDSELANRIHRMRAFISARRRSGRAGVPIAPSNAELWKMTEPAELDHSPEKSLDLDRAGAASFFDRFADYTLGFYDLLERNRLLEAQQWLHQMRLAFGPTDSRFIALRLGLLEAMHTYYSGDRQTAGLLLDTIRAEFRRRGLRHDWWQANCLRLWCFARLGDEGAAYSKLLAETEALLNSMAGTLTPDRRALFELNKWSESEAHLAARINEIVAERDACRAAGWPLRWLLQWRARRHLDELIAAIDDRRIQLVPSTPLGSRSPWWRRVLFSSRSRITLSFVVLPDRVFIVREGFLRFGFAIAPVTRLRIRELVRGWHEAVAAGSAHEHEALKCAAELAAQLNLKTLLTSTPSFSELRIVPDDALHGFPFAALRIAGGYLVERVAVSCDGTHVSAPVIRKHNPKRTALVTAMSLASDTLPGLPGTLREAKTIAALFAQSGFKVIELFDAAATPAAFLEALSGARMAHVACHGVFARDDLRRTGLVLAPGIPSGLVSLMDLGKRHLGAIDHITLTSCWSADNYLLPGRHVLNLPRVLRGAGARSVLASLWAVDDDTAEAFHAHFYNGCDRNRPSKALQLSQQAGIRGEFDSGGKASSSSFYWAGFTLYASE